MPIFELEPGVTMLYRDDDFTDGWRAPEGVALFLHGNGESGVAWNGWMPSFGRRFRVVRPDMRGFGGSTPMPIDYPWSVDALADDYRRLIAHLGLEPVHLIGAKTGGPIAMRLAAEHPELVRSLTLVGCPENGEAAAPNMPAMYEQMDREGVEGWARATMRRRLGSDAPPQMLEGWSKLMGSTAKSTQLGYVQMCARIDIAPDVPRIAAPALVITTVGSGLGSVEQTRAWQQRIARSELFVIDADSYHVAVSHPELCARAALDFIDRTASLV
ncbi:MAG TPA: alpha/beta hydrolase [Candidatus Elarobacter sp.]|nr:alpha/beta hydrolase [Candidatus Elarobacter sp.]